MNDENTNTGIQIRLLFQFTYTLIKISRDTIGWQAYDDMLEKKDLKNKFKVGSNFNLDPMFSSIDPKAASYYILLINEIFLFLKSTVGIQYANLILKQCREKSVSYTLNEDDKIEIDRIIASVNK